MPDTKVSALTANTDPQIGDLLYLVDNPGVSPASQRITVRSLTKGWGHNVLQYGATGNANYSTGGGADDSDYIEDCFAAAKVSGGDSIAYVPGGRTYRITRTIAIPTGITVQGLGGFDNAQETPPTFVWDGSDGGVAFEITTANENVFMTSIRNICVTSKASGNRLGTAFKFVTTGGAAGKLDSGTSFEDVWVLLTSSHAIELVNNGATNFSWRRGRFDSIGGYAIKANLGGSGKQFVMRGEGMTYQGGTGGQGMGFLFLDGESATGNGDGVSFVTIDGLHTEINQDLSVTYAAGVNPYDDRGIIRLGVKPSLTTLQHRLRISGWHNSTPSVDSFSAVHITAASGAAADAADKVDVIIDLGQTLSGTNTGDAGASDEIRMFGGLVPSERMYPWKGNFQHSRIEWGMGPDNTGGGVRTFIHHRDGAFCVRGLGTTARQVSQLDPFPIGPAYGYVTDATSTVVGSTPVGGGSNHVLVFNRGTGSSWKIYATV